MTTTTEIVLTHYGTGVNSEERIYLAIKLPKTEDVTECEKEVREFGQKMVDKYFTKVEKKQ